MTLSVRLSDEEGAPLVQNLLIKQQKACMSGTLMLTQWE